MLVDPLCPDQWGPGPGWSWGTMLGAVPRHQVDGGGPPPNGIFGYSSEEGKVIFGLSVAQAAATLAATLVGYDLGIFGDDVLNGVILMIFVTCVMAPWVVEPVREGCGPCGRPREPLGPGGGAGEGTGPRGPPGVRRRGFWMWRSPSEKPGDQTASPSTPCSWCPGVPEAGGADGEAMLGHAVRYAAAAEIPLLPLTPGGFQGGQRVWLVPWRRSGSPRGAGGGTEPDPPTADLRDRAGPDAGSSGHHPPGVQAGAAVEHPLRDPVAGPPGGQVRSRGFLAR